MTQVTSSVEEIIDAFLDKIEAEEKARERVQDTSTGGYDVPF